MSKNVKEYRLTQDGSYTLYSGEYDECYHSTRDGALNESLHKHVIPAFSFAPKKSKLTILDICFGLGYNTLATIYYCIQNGIKIELEIFSPEFDLGLVQSLKTFVYPKEFAVLKPIIDALSEKQRYQDDQYHIEIIIGDARANIKEINKEIDIIYQDPFSPAKNPLLWTREYFKDIYSLTSSDAILTTYSIATPVRLGLYESGFYVYEYASDYTRSGTIASKSKLPLKLIDMELKKQRNPEAKSLRG
jgi:tRNA U34 5-methylaminomethyl-2-thiouridine-forming methyltransferase MnmC